MKFNNREFNSAKVARKLGRSKAYFKVMSGEKFRYLESLDNDLYTAVKKWEKEYQDTNREFVSICKELKAKRKLYKTADKLAKLGLTKHLSYLSVNENQTKGGFKKLKKRQLIIRVLKDKQWI